MSPGALAGAVKGATEVGAAHDDLKKLKKSCDGIESSFLKQMLTAMHKTVAETKLGGDDTGEENYRDMTDNAIADTLAQRGTLGISKMTYAATSARVLNDALYTRK